MKVIKVFLRFAISAAFLNAVAGRFGWWSKTTTAAEGWESFLDFTQRINPLIPEGLITPIGVLVTGAEVTFASLLLMGLKTELVAKLSGFLILLFALAILTSLGLKSVLDNSVLAISAAAFGLSTIKVKFLEIDTLLNKS